jgi:pimeloyl-ACP methyl ester carboxylesterase
MRSRNRVRRARAATTAVVAALILVSTTVVAGAFSPQRWPTVRADVNAKGIPPFYSPPRPMPADPPGTLIRIQEVTHVPDVPADATVWRILYHSRSIYGADIVLSGYAIVPHGNAPPGGFPILAWAHGTSGFSGICAPSLFTKQGDAGPYLIPGADTYLKDGFVIAAADYQGLGTSGLHPYLLGKSEGQAVLDAARAVRQLPGVRTRNQVVIYGHSQGGQSAFFAGEMAPNYAGDLHVVGVVAAAPVTDMTAFLKLAFSPSSGGYLVYSIPTAYTWARTYSDLPLLDFFTQRAAGIAARIVPADCEPGMLKGIAAHHLTPQNVFAPGASQNLVILAHAAANDAGQVKTGVPMLVVQGTADTTVPPKVTDAFITGKACPIGDTVDYLHVTGAAHSTIVFDVVPTISQWMLDRLRGAPAPTTCGLPGDVSTVNPDKTQPKAVTSRKTPHAVPAFL